jgi:glycosyltransferase involved in cell wall biosynthesis
MAEASPLLSIIATSYSTDRLRDIFLLLDSIKEQTFKNIEIVFVAERSTELYNKVKIYAEGKATPNVYVLFNEAEPGASASRNLGIEYAHGEILSLVDDDVILFPNWAEDMVKTYDDDSIIGVTGPALPLWEDESMSWFPDEFSWLWGGTLWSDWHNEIREIRNVGGMNCSFRREAFDKAGGYLTSLKTLQEGGWFQPTGEEVEFSLRVRKITGKRIVFNPRVSVYHKVYKFRFRWGVIAKRAFRMGYLRHMGKSIYPEGDGDLSASGVEYGLLKRSFTRLLPDILRALLKHPIIAWRKLSVVVIGVLFTGLGYIFYVFRPFKP